MGFAAILEAARADAAQRGWSEPAGAIYYAPAYGVCSIRFFQPGGNHGAAGVGPAMLYYDGMTGRDLVAQAPGPQGGAAPGHGPAAAALPVAAE